MWLRTCKTSVSLFSIRHQSPTSADAATFPAIL